MQQLRDEVELDARLRGLADEHRAFAVFLLGFLEVVGNRLNGLVPADLLELAGAALTNALQRHLQPILRVNMGQLANATQADGRMFLVRYDIARLDQRDTFVANSALQVAPGQAMELMAQVRRSLLPLGRGLRGCQHAPADGRAHSARAGKARSCGAGSLQETASSESARGMGCFGHLSSFEFPGIEPRDATRTCGERIRREWIATMPLRRWVLDSLRLRLLNCAGRYPLFW